jgi:hypothetical protein
VAIFRREFGGARYGWNWKMMGGKFVDLLARMEDELWHQKQRCGIGARRPWSAFGR